MNKTILQARFDEYTQLIDSLKGALEKENWQITDAPFHLSDKIDDLLNSRNEGLNWRKEKPFDPNAVQKAFLVIYTEGSSFQIVKHPYPILMSF